MLVSSCAKMPQSPIPGAPPLVAAVLLFDSKSVSEDKHGTVPTKLTQGEFIPMMQF